MKRDKRKKKKVLSVLVLLLLVLGITIGYAVLSQTLTINGTSKISVTTWNVHFENVQVTTGSVTATTAPTATGTETTSLTYEVTLAKPGDFYEFTVDVKNGGGIDAKLASAPTITGPSTAQEVYTNYSFTNSDGSAVTAGTTLAAGASKKYKVRVEYDPNIEANQLPTAAQTITLTASMNWEQA